MNADVTVVLTFSVAAMVGKWSKRELRKVLCLALLSVSLSGDFSSTLFYSVNLLRIT